MNAEFVSTADGVRFPFPPEWRLVEPTAALSLAQVEQAVPLVVFKDKLMTAADGSPTTNTAVVAFGEEPQRPCTEVTIRLYVEPTDVPLKDFGKAQLKRDLASNTQIRDVNGEEDLRRIKLHDKFGAEMAGQPAFHYSYGLVDPAVRAWGTPPPTAPEGPRPAAPDPASPDMASPLMEGTFASFDGTVSTIGGGTMPAPAPQMVMHSRGYTRSAVHTNRGLTLQVVVSNSDKGFLEEYVRTRIDSFAAGIEVVDLPQGAPPTPDSVEDPGMGGDPSAPQPPAVSSQPKTPQQKAVEAAYQRGRIILTSKKAGLKLELPYVPMQVQLLPAPTYHVPTPSGPIPHERAGSLLFIDVAMEVNDWEASFEETPAAATTPKDPFAYAAVPLHFQIEVENLKEASFARTLTLGRYHSAKMQQRADCSLYTSFESTTPVACTAARGRVAQQATFSCHSHDVAWKVTTPIRAQSIGLVSDGKGYNFVYVSSLKAGEYEAHMPWFTRFVQEALLLPRESSARRPRSPEPPVYANTSEAVLEAAFPTPSIEHAKCTAKYRTALKISAAHTSPESTTIWCRSEEVASKADSDQSKPVSVTPPEGVDSIEVIDVEDIIHIMRRYQTPVASPELDSESESDDEPAPPTPQKPPTPPPVLSLREMYEDQCKQLGCKTNSNLIKKLPMDPTLNDTVQEIDLSMNYCGLHGLQAVLSLLPVMVNVDTLHLNGLELDNEAVEHVVKAAVKHPKLARINLSSNKKITLISSKPLLGLLRDNPNIIALDLHETNVGAEILRKVGVLLEQNQERAKAAS